MKIDFELPEWVNKHQPLVLLAGQELVAFKWPNQDWKVKIVRCNQCGECCLDLSDRHTIFGTDDEGKCNMLRKENGKWLCLAGRNKPWSCLSDPVDIDELGCSIRYK